MLGKCIFCKLSQHYFRTNEATVFCRHQGLVRVITDYQVSKACGHQLDLFRLFKISRYKRPIKSVFLYRLNSTLLLQD
jgi:hypothetical protein